MARARRIIDNALSFRYVGSRARARACTYVFVCMCGVRVRCASRHGIKHLSTQRVYDVDEDYGDDDGDDNADLAVSPAAIDLFIFGFVHLPLHTRPRSHRVYRFSRLLFHNRHMCIKRNARAQDNVPCASALIRWGSAQIRSRITTPVRRGPFECVGARNVVMLLLLLLLLPPPLSSSKRFDVQAIRIKRGIRYCIFFA